MAEMHTCPNLEEEYEQVKVFVEAIDRAAILADQARHFYERAQENAPLSDRTGTSRTLRGGLSFFMRAQTITEGLHRRAGLILDGLFGGNDGGDNGTCTMAGADNKGLAAGSGALMICPKVKCCYNIYCIAAPNCSPERSHQFWGGAFFMSTARYWCVPFFCCWKEPSVTKVPW